MTQLPAVTMAAPAQPPDTIDADAELMLALQRGEDLALNELIQRWQGPLVAFFQRSTGRYEEAVDLAQETFVRVYSSRHRYQRNGKFSTWLFTIAANLARNFARWRSRHPTVELATLVSRRADGASGGVEDEAGAIHQLGSNSTRTTVPSPPDSEMEARERADAVRKAIQSLPEEVREALILFNYQDLSYRDIASIQRTSEKTVENRLYRARQLLKEKLRDLMPQ